ncbi:MULTISPECIES: hypothetical protein [Flavobacterium]|uniref:hypothetical protein n=1 Tax=Flavobacterium TaxID=237 RepID=UPI001FCB6B00|nr:MULTISPECIES: hypothetical protein [Flavobacterium]UOK43488.1 hypothetical protein LZF87_05040 [Flavobacterium enshiense]
MKTVHYKFFALILLLFIQYSTLLAQETKKYYLTVTTMHRNFEHKEGKAEDWLALEKEYFDKVIKKNDLILATNVLNHYYTANNDEILFVFVYDSWDAIKKAWDKNEELVKQAWPDEKARKAYFEKRDKYYKPNHSDEIYSSHGNPKNFAKTPDKPMVYYVRKSELAMPKDGTDKEFDDLSKQVFDNLYMKNDVIKAYYPHKHAWGSNNLDFVEVFVVENLGDLENSWKKEEELFKAKWKDEKSQNEFEKKMGKYFTGQHGDYIYRSVPELIKVMVPK